MRALDLSTTSFPTERAAEHFGIDRKYAYLMADSILAIMGDIFGDDTLSAWPLHHYWHQWAVNSAYAEYGMKPVEGFGEAMIDYYKAKLGLDL